MSTGRGLGDMAVQVACAFSEAFFAVRDDNDGVQVPLGQAHVFATGRVDLWDGWYAQPPEVKQLVGRFLRLRHNELAAHNRFFAAARRQFTAADAPYALPAGVPSYEAVDVVAMHGQEPLEFAAQILDDMEQVQIGLELLGKGNRIAQGIVRPLAEIRGHEDAVQVDHGCLSRQWSVVSGQSRLSSRLTTDD